MSDEDLLRVEYVEGIAAYVKEIAWSARLLGCIELRSASPMQREALAHASANLARTALMLERFFPPDEVLEAQSETQLAARTALVALSAVAPGRPLSLADLEKTLRIERTVLLQMTETMRTETCDAKSLEVYLDAVETHLRDAEQWASR